MDADSSYGGSDTAQDLHSNHDNNSFNDTTTHTHDSPSTTITVTTPTESNSFYHKNEITLPVNYDENDYQKQQEQQPHYLTTANLNINETTENPTSNLEEMSKNFKSTSRLNVMDDNPSANGGLDNPAFVKADDDDECNNKVEIKSTFDHNRPYNGDLNTTAALGLSSPTNNNKNNDEQQLAEAVNLELINLKPTNGKDVTGMYENGMSTIPIKRENDNEIGNPYDEYFVPVNEHRKYMRGEKLYVTMDKRSKKTRNKCLCWGVCLCIVAAAVIIGILAAVGVIGNQGAHPVQEASARHFSGDAPEAPVKIKKGGVFGLPPDVHDEEAVTTLRPTPGPPVSTVSSLLPMTETSMIQVPRALESQLIIDNLQFMPELNDSNSAEFKQLAQSLETELKNSLFDNNVLKHGAADIEVKILDFTSGSVVVHYRIVWTFKDGIHNPQDPINPDMAKRKLRSLLAKNNGMIGDYSVSEKSITSGPVLDSCRIDNYGCEFNCSFDYQLADFICTCPQHKILANDRKTCIDYDENHLPDFPFDHNEHLQPEPEATDPPEDLYGVHHDYHETIVQPTSEPAPEPQPEPELTSKHPEAEPEPTNPPEEINDTLHNYHETIVQPTSEPTSEPSPEPQHEDVVVQPEPEPTAKSEPQPEPTAKTEIEPEINTQINIVSHENYIHIHEVTSSPEPITEPNAESNIEPVAEPTSEPAPEPTSEPSAEPTSKSTSESDDTEDSTMPTPLNASKTVEYNVIPLISTVTEPAAEPTAEPTVEPVAEPTSEPAPEPVILTVPEPTSEPSAEPAAEPAPEPSIEHVTDRSEEPTVTPEPVAVTESVDKSTGRSIEINVPIVIVPTEPAAETTAEPTAEPAAEPTIAPHLSENLASFTESNAVTTTEPSKESIDDHNSINSVGVSVKVPVESTTEPIAEPTTEPIAQSTDPPSETNELVKESEIESVNETITKASVELVSESVTEHINIDNEANTIKVPEMISNIVTTTETVQNSSMEEITELPKEVESSRSLAIDLSEHNDSKTENPLETTMQPMTESTPKQEDAENHIPEIVAETTMSQFESNSGTTQNAIETETPEVTTMNDKVSAETTTENEPLLNIQTESPLLSVIPLEEAKTNSEQSPRQSKLNDVNPDEVETTTVIGNMSNISEKNLEEIKTEEPFHQTNSIVVSVNESKTESPRELTISVNNATETIKVQEPKIYEITKPPSEAERDFNEIHSTVIDHQPSSNMSHLNIIQESTENNSAFDNMSPFLPEIDNDTFVNKLHLGEHYFEQHTEETPPPRLDNDEKNETNPLDVTHKINETVNVISTENPGKFKEKLEKSTLPPEIINNVHSNPFFENLKEIKLLEEVKNNSGVDSSTEDLLALETTTSHQNTTENSVQFNQSTTIHAEIIQTATETVNVIAEDTEESSEKSYAVEESYNDITTTERLFVPKVQTTTEVTLVANPDVDLLVVPLEDTENDISAEEHSVLDKFTRQPDEITTTPETIIETSRKCLNDQFLCINGTSKDGSYCIPIENRCDSTQDCSDGSDELDCKGNCHENFQCSNGQCLKRYLVCDGIQHCSDGTDESNCAQWNCTAAEFSCGDHQRCLPSEWRCDGRKHCTDGSDEHNCNQTCPETSHYCKDEGICIPMSWRCDGKSDCSNSEDEQSCSCNDNQFRCSLGGGCIDSKQRCDGVEDCADRSDEWNCIRLHNRIVQIATGNNTWSSVCSENWNETYSNIVCNYLGYSGAVITENADSSNDTNYLKLKPEQNVSILKQFDNLDKCENIVAVTCQEFNCGGNHQTVEEQQARIIGGSPSTETQWPSLSLLYNKKSNIQCTATILTPIWAIASYSCVNGTDWILYAGNTNFFNNPANATTQMVEVERIIQHPQVKFAQFEYTNDVVLIKLRKPLILTRNVSAVCLPENNIATRQLCVVAGWGVSQPGETNNQYLHYLPVPVIDNIECNSTKHYNGLITTDKICAGFTDSTKTPCYNDEGAPLMCFSDSASIWELQGTLSYHDNCGTSNHPAIYTSINPNIKEWIVNTIGQSPLKRA